MGGRGSRSISVGGGQVIDIGNGSSGGQMYGMVMGTPDSREDIQTVFGEIGFDGVYGTDDMGAAVLGAYGYQLNQLERKYHAVSNSEKVDVSTVSGGDFYAAVSYIPGAEGVQTLILNKGEMSSVSSVVAGKKASESSGWSMPTDGSVRSRAMYTVTHEYGHILHNQLYTQAKAKGYTGTRNQWIAQQMKGIRDTAVKKYGGSQKDLSQYGATNSREAFAESFASAHLGNPTAMGKAMNDWLKSQGF